MTLTTKHHTDANATKAWHDAISAAYTSPDRSRADALIERAAERLAATAAHATNPGLTWSGGKDSAALLYVAHRAGIQRGMCGLTRVEFPEYERWAHTNLPDGIDVFYRDTITVEWVAKHPDYLFPADYKSYYGWTVKGHQWAQNRWAHDTNTDMLIFGRRTGDGNSCGPGGIRQRRDGITLNCPIYDWTHDDVLCVLGAYNAPLPPQYWWPRALRHTTGRWPNRERLVGGIAQNWHEIAIIDRTVVEDAARVIDSARHYLDTGGATP